MKNLTKLLVFAVLILTVVQCQQSTTSSANIDRRIKKITKVNKDKKETKILNTKQIDEMITDDPIMTTSQLQIACNSPVGSLHRDYSCLELSIVSLSVYDVKTLQTILNTILLLKANAKNQKQKALVQMNRSSEILKRILQAKQTILGQARQLLVSTYLVSTVTLDQTEVVGLFLDDYCVQYQQYSTIVREWRQQVGVYSSWTSLRRTALRYFQWNIQVQYPYFYSTFWISSNDRYFSYTWFNQNVYTCYTNLDSLVQLREPRQSMESLIQSDKSDNMLQPLVMSLNQVDTDNQLTEDQEGQVNQSFEDQLTSNTDYTNNGSLEKLVGQLKVGDEQLQSDIQKYNYDNQEEEKEREVSQQRQQEDRNDHQEREAREQNDNQARQKAEQDRQKAEQAKQKAEQSRQPEHQSKYSMDLNSFGNDLDNFNQQEQEQQQEQKSDDCYEVVENEFDFETCPGDLLAEQPDYCADYCIKSQGMEKKKGIKREYEAKYNEEKSKKEQQVVPEHQQQQQQQQGNDFQSDMYKRLSNIHSNLAGKLTGKHQETAGQKRLHKQQMKKTVQVISQGNQALLGKIANLLGTLTQDQKHSHHHRS